MPKYPKRTKYWGLEDDEDEPSLKAEIAKLKKSNAALKAASTRAAKDNADLRKANKKLTLELDSACAAFSDALVQADKARKEVAKKYPQLKEVYALAEAAAKASAYIRATAEEDNPPGIAVDLDDKIAKLVGF